MTVRDDRPTDAAAEPPFHRLMRDILVNVIANLIAAAIIYVFGAAVGLLPFEPRAILFAATVLTMALGLLVFVVAKTFGWLRKQDAATFFFMIAFGLLSLSAIFAGFVPDVLSWWERIGYVIMGLVGLFCSYQGVRVIQISRQIRQL